MINNIINIGISPCPNDVFIFGPIIRKCIALSFQFKFELMDVEQLNRNAIDGCFDMVKVSFGVLPKIVNKYIVLTCGGALGHGNGPLVVTKNFSSVGELRGRKIAFPGENTTAFLLFKHFFGEDYQFVEMRFDKIFSAIMENNVDAGIIIHEGRFVYEKIGLKKLVDLGEEWEEKYFLPIPLGAIVLHEKYSYLAEDMKALIRKSIRYSNDHFEESKEFCKQYAQELDDKVLENHIRYFVNEYSDDMSQFKEKLSNFLGISNEVFV